MRSSDKKNEKRDVVEMLLKMNDRFGEFSSGFDKVMRMYGPFNNRPGLMFKVSSVYEFDLQLSACDVGVNFFLNVLIFYYRNRPLI